MAEEPLTTRFEVEGAEEAVSAIQQVWQAYRHGIPITKEMIAARREESRQILEARRCYMLIRTEMRLQNAIMLEVNRSLLRIASVGRAVMNMWMAYNVAQIRVERTSRDVADAEQDVAKWQELVNRYLRDFGEESSYYLDAAEELQKANKRLEDAQKTHQKAIDDTRIGYITMGLQAVGVFADLYYFAGVYLPTVTRLLNATGAAATGAAGGFTALGGAAGGLVGLKLILGKILPFAAGLFYIAAGLYAYWNELATEWNEKVVPAATALAKELGLVNEQGEWLIDWLDILKGLTYPIKNLFSTWIDYVADFLELITGIVRVIKEFIEVLLELAKWGLITPPISPARAPAETVPPAEDGMQIGGIIPFTGRYLLHAGERVERAEIGRREIGIREVTITNYFGSITGEIDLKRAGKSIYDAFIEEMEAKM